MHAMQILLASLTRLLGHRGTRRSFAALQEMLDVHGPFEYILDGANIGFFGQGRGLKEVKGRDATARCRHGEASGSCDGAVAPRASVERRTAVQELFQYEQVEGVLRAARVLSARVLLVLHTNHTVGVLPGTRAAELLARWRAGGMLYVTPKGLNDDIFWLYAAIASPGGCRVVSNDEMRDHHFTLLHERAFLAWKERHLVRFDFRRPSAIPALSLPRPFTPAVQEDESSGTWHFPSALPARWLCAWPVVQL